MRCPRCDATLLRRPPNSLERTLALTLAGLILFVVANAFPFLSFEMKGLLTTTTLSTRQVVTTAGVWPVAITSAFSTTNPAAKDQTMPRVST